MSQFTIGGGNYYYYQTQNLPANQLFRNTALIIGAVAGILLGAIALGSFGISSLESLSLAGKICVPLAVGVGGSLVGLFVATLVVRSMTPKEDPLLDEPTQNVGFY